MSWDYEDLFNNRLTGDGSFLEEPSFIRVGQMGYRRRTTVSGPRIDAEVFPVFGRRQRGELRRAKSQITREAQQRLLPAIIPANAAPHTTPLPS